VSEERDNVVNVSVCSSCHNLTQMKPIQDDLYFCMICQQQFKQYKNGKLVYIPIGIARSMGNKVAFVFSPNEELEKELARRMEEDDLQKEVNDDISFETELDNGIGIDFEFDPDLDDSDETN